MGQLTGRRDGGASEQKRGITYARAEEKRILGRIRRVFRNGSYKPGEQEYKKMVLCMDGNNGGFIGYQCSVDIGCFLGGGYDD